MFKKLFLIVVILLTFFSFFCSNPTDTIRRSDFIGTWSETDTTIGAQSWTFTNSIVGHGFKDLDTCGKYSSWNFDNETLYLIDGNNEEFTIIYDFINKNEIIFGFKSDGWIIYMTFFKQM